MDRMFNRRKSNYGIIVPSFLVGAIVGAGLVMFANSGTREDVVDYIKDAGENIKNRAEDMSDEARYRAGKVAGRTEEQFRR
jgi:hypothetical protein